MKAWLLWRGLVVGVCLAALTVGVTACEPPWDKDSDKPAAASSSQDGTGSSTVANNNDGDEEDTGGGTPRGSITITISRGT